MKYKHVKQQRAELLLEIDLLTVINKRFKLKATKCEAKLTRPAILSVLGSLTKQIASEI